MPAVAISRPFLRTPIIAALCLALCALAGCSALRIGYSQAPDLAYWWLDSYADFNDAQTPRVRDALAAWFGWHRRTQLPDYTRLLARAEKEVLADTTAERGCEWWGELIKRMDTALDQAAPAAAEIVLSLTPPQLQQLERRYAKANAEFRDDYLQPDLAQRFRAAVKRTVDRAESLYGRLGDAQQAQVAKALAQSPFDPDVWLSERQRRQQDALQTLRKLLADGANHEQAQLALHAYVDRVERSPREAYRRYADQLLQFNCAFAANLHNGATAAQRRAAADRLKGWEDDLRALIAEAAQ